MPASRSLSLSRFRLLPALLLLAGLVQAQSPGTHPYAGAGPFEVGTVDSLTLGAGESVVETRVYFPRDGAGPFPLIVFSHGLGGSKDIFGTVTSHWASHGYVVVQPSHDDEGVGFGGDGMQPPEAKVRERLGNVITVLDSLSVIENAVPALAGKLDEERLAVAGHSYGSFITLLAGGASVAMGDQADVSLADSRVRCIVPISPSGRGDYGLHDRSFDALDMPALFFTGTRDRRNGRPEDWRMEPYVLSPPGDKYLIVIEDASHGQFGGDVPSDAPDYVKAATAAFWDYCLKGEQAGRAWLDEPAGFLDFADGRATLESK